MSYLTAISEYTGERNYHYGIYHNWIEITRRYQLDGLFRIIVDSPAEQAFKKGYEIKSNHAEIVKRLKENLNRLNYIGKFTEAVKWARLYGGSIIVITCDDGQDITKPLDFSSLTHIADIEVYERPSISFAGVNPEILTVRSIRGSFDIHISRCLIFRNGVLPQLYANYYDLFFGEPEYSRLKIHLDAASRLNSSIPQMFENSVQYVYKVEGLASKMSTEGGEEEIMRRMSVIRQGRTLFGMAAIDAGTKDGSGESLELQTYTLSGHSEMADGVFNMLSAVSEIPQTILFGRSPAGQNATGDADFESYYNLIERTQEHVITPNLIALIDLLKRASVNSGEFFGTDFDDLEITALPLKNMTEKELSEIEQLKASAEQTRANTLNTYLQMDVLSDREIRQVLTSKGNINGVEIIFDDLDSEFSDEEIEEPEWYGRVVSENSKDIEAWVEFTPEQGKFIN